jgi:hypothetical protein
MVPLIPDIDLISGMCSCLIFKKVNKSGNIFKDRQVGGRVLLDD